MASHHTCPCGKKLPDDRRIKFCDRCRGARTKQQERERSARAAESFEARIWWLYFKNALIVSVSARFDCDGAGLDQVGVQRVARAAGVPPHHVAAALEGKPVTRLAFRRLCKWMQWNPGIFEHRARRMPPTSHARTIVEKMTNRCVSSLGEAAAELRRADPAEGQTA